MAKTQDFSKLYQAGSVAALIAGLLFRRNIGAEVTLFTGVEAIPQTVADWFSLLQTRPLVGLSFLAAFDLANYLLEGLIFLALGLAVWRVSKSAAAIALASGSVGIGVSFASNISLTMLSLSHSYATATSEAQRSAWLAAGQATLAGKDPLAVYPSTGAYMSVLLIALAGLLLSSLLLRSHRAVGIVGLLASGCDLMYCLTVFIAPALRTLWMASGGLFWMVWHLLVAWVLWKYAKEETELVSIPAKGM